MSSEMILDLKRFVLLDLIKECFKIIIRLLVFVESVGSF